MAVGVLDMVSLRQHTSGTSGDWHKTSSLGGWQFARPCWNVLEDFGKNLHD
jgi:hypothetical protein